MLNESAEMKNCNNVIYFENRKHQDLYMWLAKCPNGPSIKFLVSNSTSFHPVLSSLTKRPADFVFVNILLSASVHTMDEMKLTGNCLKGARPIMSFDKSFDSQPHYKLLKEMILQVFRCAELLDCVIFVYFLSL